MIWHLNWTQMYATGCICRYQSQMGKWFVKKGSHQVLLQGINLFLCLNRLAGLAIKIACFRQLFWAKMKQKQSLQLCPECQESHRKHHRTIPSTLSIRKHKHTVHIQFSPCALTYCFFPVQSEASWFSLISFFKIAHFSAHGGKSDNSSKKEHVLSARRRYSRRPKMAKPSPVPKICKVT